MYTGIYILNWAIIYISLIFSIVMERKTEKKDNFFSIEVREAEEVTIKAGDDSYIFIAPFDGFMKCYLGREQRAIQWK